MLPLQTSAMVRAALDELEVPEAGPDVSNRSRSTHPVSSHYRSPSSRPEPPASTSRPHSAGEEDELHVSKMPQFLQKIMQQPAECLNPEGQRPTERLVFAPLTPTKAGQGALRGRRSLAGSEISGTQSLASEPSALYSAAVRGRRRMEDRHKSALDVLNDTSMWADDISRRRLFEHVDGQEPASTLCLQDLAFQNRCKALLPEKMNRDLRQAEIATLGRMRLSSVGPISRGTFSSPNLRLMSDWQLPTKASPLVPGATGQLGGQQSHGGRVSAEGNAEGGGLGGLNLTHRASLGGGVPGAKALHGPWRSPTGPNVGGGRAVGAVGGRDPRMSCSGASVHSGAGRR